MIDAPLALAFTAGMIASINPCGFALLPAYVGAFVTGGHTTVRADRRILRAVGVSAAVSTGFAVMFITVGIIFSSVSAELRRHMPWVTIAIGVIMLAMGVASIAGWKPRLRHPVSGIHPDRTCGSRRHGGHVPGAPARKQWQR